MQQVKLKQAADAAHLPAEEDLAVLTMQKEQRQQKAARQENRKAARKARKAAK